MRGLSLFLWEMFLREIRSKMNFVNYMRSFLTCCLTTLKKQWKEAKNYEADGDEPDSNRMGGNADKEFLRTEPLGKLLLKLALPTVAAQLINMLYNIVDRIYIGHIPDVGATALTGVGVCMPLIMIVSAFAALVGYGGAPRASIFMGRQDKDTAEKILRNCFVLQIIISIILTAVLLIWNRDFPWPLAPARIPLSMALTI